MKKIKLLIIAVILLGSCKNWDFGDTNKDPIGPTEPSPKDMLAGGMMNFFNNRGRPALINPTLYIQWQVQTIYTSEMRYADNPVDWDPWYVGVLSNFKTNIEYIDEHRNESLIMSMGDPDNQIAVNKIMMAYIFKFVTDIYGDIPFSEALDPANQTPKYDNQIEIYHGIINMLKEARDMIDTNKPGVVGDIVYNGDMNKWILFANSLILHTALQLSNVPSEVDYAKAEFNDALNPQNGGVIESISDEGWVFYQSGSWAISNPYSWVRPGDYVLAKEFTDALQGEANGTIGSCSPSYNHTPDAREYVYSDSPGDDGKLYSCDNGSSGGNAGMSPLFMQADSPLPFFMAAWVYLDRAEAAARGWTSENFDDMLTNAINESYNSLAAIYGVDITSFAAGYAAARVADANDATYGGATSPEEAKLRVVAEEKWVAYYPMGFEAWAQWRRLSNYLQLTPHPQAINTTGQIPRRYKYPKNESTLNPEGYRAGVNDLTPAEDRNDSRVPWDQ